MTRMLLKTAPLHQSLHNKFITAPLECGTTERVSYHFSTLEQKYKMHRNIQYDATSMIKQEKMWHCQESVTLLIPGAKVRDEKNAHNMMITMPLL
jgi:hypothetical protein